MQSVTDEKRNSLNKIQKTKFFFQARARPQETAPLNQMRSTQKTNQIRTELAPQK